MTEAEWLANDEPEAMLEALMQGQLRHSPARSSPAPRPSDRKYRLFAVACCRQSWHLLTDKRSRRAVEVAERYADGLEAVGTFKTAMRGAMKAWQDAGSPDTPCRAVADMPWDEANRLVSVQHIARYCAGRPASPAAQAGLLRDIFGNPFRPHRPPGRLDNTAASLAQAAYEERLPDCTLDNARLAVLSDALEEAGCTDADVLSHLRSPGPHVRGCWALDLFRQEK